MTQLRTHFVIVDEWPAPRHWRQAAPDLSLSQGEHPRRPSHLARVLAAIVAAILAADARYRERQHLNQMCDRMRRDVGLPGAGQDARRRARLLLEGPRWW